MILRIEQPDPQSLTRRILGKVLFSWPCVPAWAPILQLIYHGSQYGSAAVMGSGQHMNASILHGVCRVGWARTVPQL